MTFVRRLFDLYKNNPEEFRRIALYLVVGGWNTVFGIAVYTALVLLFGERHYLLLGIPANVLAITNAFLCYKYIVFRSKGPFWQEYLKCYIVYGGMALVGMAEMYLLVDCCRIPPIYANIAATFLNIAISYFGHKYFSFGKSKQNCHERPTEK